MAKKVLILGGGFAGLSAAKHLARRGAGKVSVTLVDRRCASEFSPLYPDTVSQRVRPRSISFPLALFCRKLGVEFIRAEVRAVDLEDRRVETSAAAMEADFVLLCLGCTTHYFGNREIASRAPGLKSLQECLKVRQAVLDHVHAACARQERFGLFIVGGGYTGIELASHLAVLLREQTGLSRQRLGKMAEIVVLEKAPRLLAMMPPGVSDWVVKTIGAHDVHVRTGVTVDAFEEGGTVRLTNGERLENALLVWTAGVTPVPAAADLNAPKVTHGRLKVDPYLRLSGHERVFAAGDVAGPMPGERREPLRMGVQFSLMGGRAAAENVLRSIDGRSLKVFDPFDPGFVVPLAQGVGVGRVFGREFHGRLPSDLHYLMCLYRSWGWRNRADLLKDMCEACSRPGSRSHVQGRKRQVRGTK